MRFVLGGALCAAAFLAAGHAAWSATPNFAVATKTRFTSATQFRDALTTSLKGALHANPTANPVDLEKTLENTVQTVFVTGNVSKGVAQLGLTDARIQLTSEGLYCPPPADGVPTSTCQAVAQALQLAEAAIDALTDDAVGALPDATTGPPGSAGGGGGGGVTHSPVS